MSNGQTPDLNGPLKKSAAKEPEKKGLGGPGLGSRSLGSDQPSSTPPAPAAPSAPINYELDGDEAAAEKPAAKASASGPETEAAFNPFDDADIKTPNPTAAPATPAPGTGRVARTGTGRIAKTGTGRIAKTGTDRVTKESRDFGDNLDLPAPGTAKDLWTCPHCGAKNKPQRETCRECHKHPDDPVEKMWFQKPPILGAVVGGIVLFIVLIMWATSVDLSLKPAGVMDSSVRSASATEEIIDLGDNRKLFVRGQTSVSGRVIKASEYPMAPWLIGVALALGDKATNDDRFGEYEASFTDTGMNVDADKYTILYLYFGDEKPELKSGDYLSVFGKSGIPEQDALIVKGTDERNSYAIKVQKYKTKE